MVKGFGISMGVSPRETFDQVGEISRQAEALGFEAMWFIDHQLGMKDVYTAMNVSAMATGAIEIGCAVTNLRTRHPTVTANATTALDELSDGRALLGLGAGWVAVHSIGEKAEPDCRASRRHPVDSRAVLGRGDRFGRRQGTARHRTPADPDLSRRLAAPHARARRRALRRRHPDGGGGPGLLQLADGVHPSGVCGRPDAGGRTSSSISSSR